MALLSTRLIIMFHKNKYLLINFLINIINFRCIRLYKYIILFRSTVVTFSLFFNSFWELYKINPKEDLILVAFYYLPDTENGT